MERFEVHAHTTFSNIRLIDCIIKIKDLILNAAKKGLSGVTITDHEFVGNAVEVLKAEKELKEEKKIPEDFKVALGNEIYLCKSNRKGENSKFFHFILIAKDTVGYRALRELSSRAWKNSFREKGMERVITTYNDLERIIAKYPNRLIGTSACLGSEFSQLVLGLIDARRIRNRPQEEALIYRIEEFLNYQTSLFGEDFYIEIAPGLSLEQVIYNSKAIQIAKSFNIKVVIGTDAHFLDKKDRFVHKTFLNSKNGDREVDDFYAYAYLMEDEEIRENLTFEDRITFEEIDQFYLNSLEIQNKIHGYELERKPIIPQVRVKDYPVIKGIGEEYPTLCALYKSENPQERYWVNECMEVLRREGLVNDIYLARLELEADIISFISEKMENCLYSYFNTFKYYIDLFWECGSIVSPGRGSAGAFLSNYLLGITQLDPIEWNLPYYRFLNKERVELPRQNWGV